MRAFIFNLLSGVVRTLALGTLWSLGFEGVGLGSAVWGHPKLGCSARVPRQTSASGVQQENRTEAVDPAGNSWAPCAPWESTCGAARLEP